MLSDLKRTGRGFRFYEFKDRNDYLCTVQKSSVATEDCLWLGLESGSPKKLVFNEGWVSVDLPEGVELNTRMHLTREQAGILAKQLKHFSESGELPAIPAT
tara:strand:- start:512 stop:814 length:303 start_codon:yes stop_codon:yes gene_type:complete